MIDNQGPVIVSFGLWSSSYKGGDEDFAADAVESAFRQADSDATAQIARFMNLSFNSEQTTERGDSKERFMERDAETGDAGVQKTERIITDRVSSQSVARAQANLMGLETVHEWTYDTPDGHTLVGVVKAYRFSGIERAREILEGPQEEPQAEEPAAQEPAREFQNSNRRGSVESSLDVF